MVRDGKPVAIAAGIRAAASRLESTQIPDDVKTKARAVIDAYEKKAGMGDNATDSDRSEIPAKKKPKPLDELEAAGGNPAQDEPDDPAGTDGSAGRDETDSRVLPFSYAAHALVIRMPSLAPPDPEKLALDPDIFAQNPPFTFRGEISNDREDAYYTRMHPTSLRNYAHDSEDGVALQNSHRADELPFGHSYRGRFLKGETQPDQIARTHADFYVIPGMKLNDVENDHLINGIKSRTVRDLSVGFYGGSAHCTLCGRNLLEVDENGEPVCRHIPGLVYRVQRGKGEEDAERAAAWIHDAHLAEVSTVYDGATPGAAIIKAQRMAECGRLNWGQTRWIEANYRIKLPGRERHFAGYDPRRGTDTQVQGDHRMSGPLPREYDDRQGIPPHTDPDQGLPAGQEPSLADLIAQAGIETTGDLNADLRAMIAGYSRLRAAVAAAPPAEPAPAGERARPPVTVSERELADARAYRARLVEEARIEAVRALGNEFDAAFHTQRWQELPLADLERERDHYALIAGRLFPGGRRTTDKAPPPGSNSAIPQTPDAAYAG
jgi:hypothetical protein